MVTFVLILSLFVAATAELGCLNEQGELVDWLILYKIPKLVRARDDLLKNGVAYVFITSENPSDGWKLSQRSINDSMSIPSLMFDHIYNPKREFFHMLYNDDPPSAETASAIYGHTKGVVISDGNTAVWIVHSVPNYPVEPVQYIKMEGSQRIVTRKNKYLYPSAALRYGQTYLCVTFNASQNNAIGKQLMFNRPKIYSRNIPKGFARPENLDLISAAEGKHVKSSPWFSKEKLKSRAGAKFVSYAKSGKFMKELYGDWIAQDLEADLEVECWSKGRGNLPSDCKKKYHVLDVREVSLRLDSGDSINLTTYQDHSKWAISLQQNVAVVCICDINRMATQLKRGGGAVCFKNAAVWKKFAESVLSVEPCPRN